MLICTFAFSQAIQTCIIFQDAQKTLKQSIKDAEESSTEMVQALGLETARNIAGEIERTGGIKNTGSMDYAALKEQYAVYEIDVVDGSEHVIYSSNPNSVDYDMASADQSREFLPLLDGAMTELAQDLMASGNVKELSLMFVGVAIEDGFVQIAYDSDMIEQFQTLSDVGAILETTHVGQNGKIYITGSDNKIVAGKYKGTDITELGYYRAREGAFYTADIFGERCY